jgi:hypothetical protein
MHTPSKRITLYASPAALVLLSLVLAACGGSSSASNSTHLAAATSPSGDAAGAGGSRFTAVRECLEKNGIKLPPRKPGQGRPPGGGFFGGGTARRLPPGVTRRQFEAAIKKCRGGFRPGARLRSPAYRGALASFAECMRSHGINLPAPNTSGNGPVFNTGSINTNSAQFKAAESACRTELRGGLPGAGATSSPPPGGEASPQ